MRKLGDLPNIEGFKFVGVFSDGSHRDCEVILDARGLHTVREWSQLVGWLTLSEQAQFSRMLLGTQ